EESITAAQVRRLEELVLAHPEAEAYYVQYRSLYADLSRHFAVLPATPEESPRDHLRPVPERETGRHAARLTSGEADKERKSWPSRFPFALSPRFLVALSGLAAGLLLVLVLWPRPRARPTADDEAAEPTDNTVAVLLRALGAEWEKTGLTPRAGAPLPPGR